MNYLHQNKACTQLKLCIAVILLSQQSLASAQDTYFSPPLAVGNRTPFTLVFISPVAPDHTLTPGTHKWSTHLDLSSHSLIESSDSANVELDGETTRLAFGWQFRPSTRWLIRAELPWISHSGGFLDSIIDEFHQVTSLPEGQRDRQPQDRLLFGYEDGSQQIFLNRQRQALGDATISAAYQLRSAHRSAEAKNWLQNSWLQLGAKLPTGRVSALSGSEATDIAISLHHNRQQTRALRPFALSFDAYMLHTGDTELIEDQKKVQWQFNVRVAKQWTPTFVPEVQLRYRTASYNNPLATLGSDSLGLDVGLTVQRPRSYWKVGFSEDLDIDSAPDVTFYLQYAHYRQ